MDYNKFRTDFEASGLTQAKYGEKIKMSTSMVNYYLRKTKPTSKAKSTSLPKKKFDEIVLPLPNSRGKLRITTPSGYQIEIS